VRAIHTTDLDGWSDNPASPQAVEFLRALGAMIARSQPSRSTIRRLTRRQPTVRLAA